MGKVAHQKEAKKEDEAVNGRVHLKGSCKFPAKEEYDCALESAPETFNTQDRFGETG